MTDLQKLKLKVVEARKEVRRLALDDDASDDDRKTASDSLASLETRHAALEAVEGVEEAVEPAPNSEERERRALIDKATVSGFLLAARKGRVITGAEAEVSDAFGAGGDIPLAMFEPAPEARSEKAETRAVTGAPGTVGVNFAPIVPAVFARSIAATMGIDMPMVPSGTFGQARFNANLTAGARTKGDAQAATAATFAVGTATPKSVSAALEFLAEDVAAAGHPNFEAALRENLSMALSAALDNQLINGDGTAPNLSGLFKALADATAATEVLTFDSGVGSAADLIDGLWAMDLSQIRQLVGLDTYRKAAKTFQPAKFLDKGTGSANVSGVGTDGPMTLAQWLAQYTGGFSTNARMPAASSNVQSGLAFRAGRPGMRTAVAPHWGRIQITDVYSGATKAQTAVTLHVLVGDVIVVQPGAYSETSYKVA